MKLNHFLWDPKQEALPMLQLNKNSYSTIELEGQSRNNFYPERKERKQKAILGRDSTLELEPFYKIFKGELTAMSTVNTQ